MNLKNLLLFIITLLGCNDAIAQNLALNMPTMASSGNSAPAVDGNLGTRWESAFTDTEWWYVDLGQVYDIGLVIINWEAAYGSVYEIQMSDDASTWMTVYTENAGNGGIDNLPLRGSGRYVRYNGLVRALPFGYSFWEFEVYEAGDPMLDASLSSLSVDGIAIPTFSSLNFTYNVLLPIGTVTVPTVVGTPTQAAASAFTTDAVALPGATTVEVTAEDGTTTATYTINFTVDQENIAAGKTATASSATQPADNAFDENTGTRWESASTDPQWIYVDLGSTSDISGVLLNWEGAYGSAYTIDISNDATNWTTVYTETMGNGGMDQIAFASTSGRYVRMYGTTRGTIYGYSLWEFEVYGSPVILPVEFSSFTATFSNTGKEQVILDWSTASETNAAYYSVERSFDATSWKIIGKVNAAGESQQELNYKHLDDELEAFRTGYYYRLKQVDFSGAFSYSSIVFVGFDTKKSNFTAFPNPATNVLHVQGTDLVLGNFSVYAITGQKVLNKVQITTSENSMTIDLSQLAPGLYLLSDGAQQQLFVKNNY